MDSWATSTTSANIKFEDSPAESLLSTPDEMYPSLFGAAGAAPSATVNPVDMLTPAEDETQPDLSMLAGLTTFTQTTMASPAPASSTTGTPEPEKKPVKKRKSWGQVLPEPKTNLPPRKRAKTEDEKEQRRVERVLRNRRAAQSSRERKRLEVEGLEQRNKELEAALHQAQQFNMTLLEEIQKIRQGAGVSVTRAAPSFEGLRQTPVTLSQELFGSQDSHGASSLEHLLQSMPSAPNKTVNPASLSPALSPVSEMDEEQDEPADAAAPVAPAPAAPQAVASPDTTQHPAVSVGGSTVLGVVAGGVPAAAAPRDDDVPSTPAPVPAGFDLGSAFVLPEAFDADRDVYESGLLSSPNSSDDEYDHLAGDHAVSFPFPNNPTTFDFDFNEFITDVEHLASAPSNEQQQTQQQQQLLLAHPAAADSSSLLLPETPNPSEDPYLQPHSGASLDGCDDGGLAVSVV